MLHSVARGGNAVKHFLGSYRRQTVVNREGDYLRPRSGERSYDVFVVNCSMNILNGVARRSGPKRRVDRFVNPQRIVRRFQLGPRCVARNRLTCGVVFYPDFVPAGLCPGGTKATSPGL